MPCSDSRDDVRVVYKEAGTQTARLCAVFTALERRGWLTQTLDAVDWEESGVTKAATLAWWDRPKMEDRARRQREARAREAARAKAKKALTREERKLLGLKD